MKISLRWLKDHLDTTATPEALADAFIALGHEVEDVSNPLKALESFKVAEVLTCQKHPEADRLSLCTVSDGSERILNIVCGAQNVRAGLKTILAHEGVVIPSTGQTLKKGKVRGIESEGMLCSAEELCLSSASEGILELSADAVPGTSAAQMFADLDIIFDISLTPNRGDCFSVRGLARDLAALGVGSLKKAREAAINMAGAACAQVTVETPLCRQFYTRVMTGVNNQATTPAWIAQRLEAAGQRLISPIVDITNYVCLDSGQPLHAFDHQVVGDALCVREASDGESLEALDDNTYTLTPGMIVVAHDKGPLSLAGIIGGKASGCGENTHTIILEAALFDAAAIALAGQKLNVYTDSRTRFERGVDPAAVTYALDLATALIAEVCGGEAGPVTSFEIDVPQRAPLPLTLAKIEAYLGYSPAPEAIVQTLNSLGFDVQTTGAGSWAVTPPTWRHDMTLDVDVIEEVARLQGYDAITPTSLPRKEPPVFTDWRFSLRKVLCARGLHEVVTWSMIPEALNTFFGQGVKLTAPLTQEMAVLRASVLPGLLTAIKNNQHKSQFNNAFFEMAHQFNAGDKGGVAQPLMLAAVRSQAACDKTWHSLSRSVDIFDSKADLFALLEAAQINPVALTVEAKAPAYYHPGRSGTLKQGPRVLGYFGEIHPEVIDYLGIKGPVVACELFMDVITSTQRKKPSLSHKLSPFQPTLRDFGFIMDRTQPADGLLKAIQKVDRTLIKQVDLFDVFEGGTLPTGKKALTVRVHVQSDVATLTDETLTQLSQKIVAAAQQACGAVLRDGSNG